MATKRVLRPARRAADAVVVASTTQTIEQKPVKRMKVPKLAVESVEASPTPPQLFRKGTLPRTFEDGRHTAGFSRVAGVDEAGRGPLAGPVVAAACVIDKSVHIEGIHDSKKLNEEEREALYELLTTSPGVSYAVSIVDHIEIDKINILQASMRAMERAVAGLPSKPDFIYVDGPYVPAGLSGSHGDAVAPLVKGDSRCYSIAAASVIAKVTRDRIMVELDTKYPDYGFAVHKGYPTPAHKAAIAKHGPCDVHRRTFAPLKVWFPLPQSEPEAERKVKTKSTASRKRAARA